MSISSLNVLIDLTKVVSFD